VTNRPDFRLLIAFFALTLAGLFPATAHAQLPPWTRYTMANGLEVLIIENHLTPIATIELAVKNGSFTEPDDFNGLSHLYEHMFFTANAVDASEEDFLRRVSRLGIIRNGTTHEENVEYYFTLPKKNLMDGLDFMADAIKSPAFREDELKEQISIVLGEFDRHESSPFFDFNRKLALALWGPNHMSRKQPLGERSTISATTRQKMLAIKEKYYIPNNSLLIVAGDVKTDEVKSLINRYFAGWMAGPDPFAIDPPARTPPLDSVKTVVDYVEVPTVHAALRWHGPSIGLDDKSTFAADVFLYIVLQQEHEYRKKLEETGLAQNISFWYYTQRYVGPISADITTTADKLAETMRVFWQQINKFDDPNYFTEEDLETAKAVLRNRIILDSEKLSEFTHTLSFWWASAGLDYYEQYLNNLDKITKADIRDYVRKYVKGKPYVLGIALSGASKRKIEQVTGKPFDPHNYIHTTVNP
jgi:zinc protease